MMMSTTGTSTMSQQMRYLDREHLQSLVTSIDARTVRVIHVISDQYIWSVRSDRTGQQMTGGVTGYQTAVMAATAALDQVAQ